MFASVSHEFRTPLNAFTNSLQIVEMTLADIKQKLEGYPEPSRQVEPFYPKMSKMLKIGKVSSKILLNLVEDILDLAKFTANTFTLNIEEFALAEVLEEIEYIFGFQ
jgi:protein-histidine pros-kinase